MSRGSAEGRREGGTGAGGTRPGPGTADGVRWGLVAAGLLVLLQVGVTVAAFVPAPHTGGDNAGYLGLAHSLLERGAYLDLYLPGEPPHTKYPPGFPLLLAGVRLLGGETWLAFKSVAAVAATATVLLTFLWVRERRGIGFAVGVGGLVAVASAVVYHSHWILSDLPFLAFVMLALWSFERAPEGSEGAEGTAGWWVLGSAAALAAVFTRTAGLPLVAAVAGYFALRRHWRALATFGVAFAVPAAAWWLRGRASEEYLSEFWLVDPYRPELGRVGPPELLERAGTNVAGYVGAHLPGGITGLDGAAAATIGVVLVALAGLGWFARIRAGRPAVGVAELFVPLYAAVVLVWPEVWSGDRFALPLIPPVLLWAGGAAAELGRRVHPRGAALAPLAGALLLAVPAAADWTASVRTASSCVSASRSGGPWSCTGRGMAEFAAIAAWSGANLPDGAVVVSRKPRFFYLLSGLKSEVFPMSSRPEAFFREAERLGARYVVLDRLDGLAGRYVVPAIRSRPETFCPVGAVGEGEAAGTRLLGVLDGAGAAAGGADAGRDTGPRLAACPQGMVRDRARGAPDYSSSRIPLFASWTRS